LGIGAIGSGGMFAVYSYITPMLVDVAGIRESIVPSCLRFGTGMINRKRYRSRLADSALLPTIGTMLSRMPATSTSIGVI